MKNSTILSPLVLIFCLSIIFTSCRKKDVPPAATAPEDTETRSLWVETITERVSNDILNMGAEFSENGNLNAFFPNAIVTSAGKTFTVDFGTTGFRGADSVKRTGKLIYDFNASGNNANSFRMPGFSFKVSSNNYSVNLWAVAINKKIITNITPISVAGQTVYSGTNLVWSDSSDISIMMDMGGQINAWRSNKTITLLNSNDAACYQGQLLPLNWFKAKVELIGTSNGSMSIVDEFGVTKIENFKNTVNSLIKDFNCAPNPLTPQDHPFISGSIDFTPGIRALRHLDYGTGTCDFSQTLTLSGKASSISL